MGGSELWERAPGITGPVSAEIQQNLETFSNVRGFKFSCFENGPPRMGRLHIYSFSKGPLRKIDVAKGTLWQQFLLEGHILIALVGGGPFRQMDVDKGPL